MPATFMDRLKNAFPWLTRRRLNWLFRSGVIVILLIVLYIDLQSRRQLDLAWQDFLRCWHGAGAYWFWPALVLMPLNWWTEMRKWYQFIRRYDPISPLKAYLAVLAGLSVSLLTPNRVGEYAGRMLFVRTEHQWKAVIANLVGNYAQFVVLIGAGCLGAAFCIERLFPIDPFVFRLLLLLGAVAVGLLLLIYFQLEFFIPLARKVPGIRHIKRFVKDIGVLRQFSRPELGSIALWSVLRYSIYATQYYCLLRFFGISVQYFEALAGISTLFLLQTSLPLPPVTGLVARGNLAVHIWTAYGANEISSLAATFALFIINLILPSFIGLIALLRINIAHSFGYEDDETN